MPTNEVPALDQVIAGLKLKNTNEDQTLLAVHSFFENFNYSLWQLAAHQRMGNQFDGLSRFLLETKSGHCEYFATATVLLLRELHLPARYAVGYYVHEPSGAGYVVRERDAHAWCLVWDKKKRFWQTFDTTPPSWTPIGEEHASALECLSDFQSWLQYEVLKFFDYSHNNIRDYIFWTLIPALAFLLYRIFRGSRRYKKPRQQEEPIAVARPGFGILSD